jgi:hypothetical protein
MLVKTDSQSVLADLPFADFIFDPKHPLLRLGRAIHWDTLVAALSPFYNETKGRPSTPLRVQAAVLILKFVKNIPDRAAVAYAQENIYAQRFCGLSPAQAASLNMHPATALTNFRRRIGPQGLAIVNNLLAAASRGKSYRRADSIILDTTCVPLDILYPTDIRLLDRCRREVLRLFRRAKGFGLKPLYRTYARTARKVFVSFAKLSKPSKQTRRRVHRQLFQFLRRNASQLRDLHLKATRALGKKCRENKQVLRFLADIKNTIATIQGVLHQQAMVRRGFVHIPGRIVSFHKNHTRPIVRGKFPLPTEFGPKVLFGLVKKRLHVLGVFNDNVSDATLILPALRWFKATFGRLPKELFADRGFFSRTWVRWLKSLGIEPGLQPRGKRIDDSTPAYRRMVRRRLPIEAFISLDKRCHGLNRCRARSIPHEPAWIHLGVAAGNAHKAFFLPKRRPHRPPGHPPGRARRLGVVAV